MFLIYLFIGLVGLAFGSFSSVLIYRLHHQEEGILWGRSKCPKCLTKLSVPDLIPIVSYLWNKCKCRYCHESISIMYPALEVSMGGLFLLTTAMTGFADPWKLSFHLFLAFTFVVLTFYDILFQEVPDEVSLPAVAVGALYVVLMKTYTLTALGIGVAVPVGFFSLLCFASRGRWLGGGDIRIGALMGVVLGWPNVLIGLFLSYLIGSVFSVIGLATKQLHRKSQIPFAPFLLLGTYIALFWGQRLLDWYLGALG